jgi:hypothetical protein
MAYQKRDLLGTNKSGSTPVRGPKTIHKTTEPVAHDHSRDYETIAGTGNIARDSTTHKRSTAAVHSGMHARNRDGTLITGMDVGRAPPDASSSNPLDTEAPAKRLTPVAPVSGQRSRTQAGECTPCAPGAAHAASAAYARDLHDARHVNAANIINEGVMMAGDPNHPRHPANLRRR